MINTSISIVITTRNRPRSFQRAFDSVLSQTFQGFDLYVIDDGSDENISLSIQNRVSQCEYARYYRHAVRKGLAAGRNAGIIQSTGDYIAFLDDDDEWKPDCLQKRVDILKTLYADDHARVGIVYCGCEIRHTDENRTSLNLPKISGEIKESICLKGLSTIPSSCLFPRKVLERVGGFDESLPSCIDHDIWMKIAAEGYQAIPVMEPLVVTYEVRRRQRMVSDTLQRIRGVEQYLAKWESAFEGWMGKDRSREYVECYRARVLGELASRKFFEGDFKEAGLLFRHVLTHGGFARPACMLLSKKFIREFLRWAVPRDIIEWAKLLRSRV